MVVHLLSGEGAARQASGIHACRSSASMSVGVTEARIIRLQRMRVKTADAGPYTFGRYGKPEHNPASRHRDRGCDSAGTG